MENNKLLISVIITAYNVDNFINKAVSSVLNQTYSNLEIIVINDASKDNTINELSKLKDSRLKVINLPTNIGIGAVRNLGLDNAKGDLITFVDGDDTIDKQMYEHLIKSIVTNNSDIACCDILEIPSKKVITGTLKKAVGDKVDITTSDVYLSNALFCSVSPCNKLYKRTLFKDLKYPEGKIFEDLVMHSKVVLRSKIISFVRMPLYFYYTNRTTSIMNNHDDNYYNQRVKQWFNKYKELVELNKELISKRCFLKLYKEYYSLKPKYKKEHTYVKAVLKKDKYEYSFNLTEKLWMCIQRYFILRKCYSLLR